MNTETILKVKKIGDFESYKEHKLALTSDILVEKVVVQSITDRIKTFEDACAEININPTEVLSIESPNRNLKSIIAYTKLITIAEALNEGWKPNFEDSNEKKWFPYFNVRGGFRFLASYYFCASAPTDVGSRLCFKTKTLAEYAGEQFVEIYNDYLMIK